MLHFSCIMEFTKRLVNKNPITRCVDYAKRTENPGVNNGIINESSESCNAIIADKYAKLSYQPVENNRRHEENCQRVIMDITFNWKEVSIEY